MNRIGLTPHTQPPPTSKPNESPNDNDRVIEGPLADQTENNDEMQQPPPLIKESKLAERKSPLPLSTDSSQMINDIPSESSKEGEFGQSYHPWRRLLARTVDVFSLGLLLIFIFSLMISILFPNSVEEYIALLDNPLAAAILIYILWIPCEAAFISIAGATPAKWIFGISVKSQSGENLSYLRSLKRALGVWMQGEAFGLYILTIITRLFAYRRLTTTGTTLWDDATDSIVSHKEWGVGRAVASTLSVLLIAIIFAVLSEMS
mgnify:FL=1|jgi:uncharacterized RDD family membrane protein YckC